MPFTRMGDVRLYWKLEGEPHRRPLVLLNSIGTDMDLWDPLLPDLRREFRLLRIDTRGHGASDAPGGDYDLPGLAADVAAIMDDAGLAKAAVAGVSLGGMIAMQLALDAPARVAALALVCTSATMDRDAWQARVDTVRGEGLAGIVDLAMFRFLSPETTTSGPAFAATIRQGLLTMAPSGYAGCGAAIRDMALADRLHAITVPTLVITGSRDTSTPLAGHGEHLLAAIPGARHLHLEAAHLAPVEAPVALAAALSTLPE